MTSENKEKDTLISRKDKDDMGAGSQSEPGFGSLSRYADAKKLRLEKVAWQEAAAQKHNDRPN